MSKYTITGNGASLFEAYANGSGTLRPLSGQLLYHTATEFGFINADGSRTYVYGAGFVWDKASGQFTGGTVSVISHYDVNGAYVDDLTGLSGVSAAALQAKLEAEPVAGSTGLSALLLAGNDRLDARWHGGGGVFLGGLTGDDWIRGSADSDQLSGGDGKDVLTGGLGDDLMLGGAGNDRLHGGAGDDRLLGDSGNLLMPGGDDVLRGGLGNDYLDAGSGNNRLYGGRGDDTLRGSTGSDLLSGGKGTDSFDFSPFAEAPRPLVIGWGHDTVTDFTVGVDHLLLGSINPASLSWTNDASGNAVLTAGAGDSITFSGIDANVTALTDLLM